MLRKSIVTSTLAIALLAAGAATADQPEGNPTWSPLEQLITTADPVTHDRLRCHWDDLKCEPGLFVSNGPDAGTTTLQPAPTEPVKDIKPGCRCYWVNNGPASGIVVLEAD